MSFDLIFSKKKKHGIKCSKRSNYIYIKILKLKTILQSTVNYEKVKRRMIYNKKSHAVYIIDNNKSMNK
jgi:hypothetical protein